LFFFFSLKAITAPFSRFNPLETSASSYSTGNCKRYPLDIRFFRLIPPPLPHHCFFPPSFQLATFRLSSRLGESVKAVYTVYWLVFSVFVGAPVTLDTPRVSHRGRHVPRGPPSLTCFSFSGLWPFGDPCPRFFFFPMSPVPPVPTHPGFPLPGHHGVVVALAPGNNSLFWSSHPCPFFFFCTILRVCFFFQVIWSNGSARGTPSLPFPQ